MLDILTGKAKKNQAQSDSPKPTDSVESEKSVQDSGLDAAPSIDPASKDSMDDLPEALKQGNVAETSDLQMDEQPQLKQEPSAEQQPKQQPIDITPAAPSETETTIELDDDRGRVIPAKEIHSPETTATTPDKSDSSDQPDKSDQSDQSVMDVQASDAEIIEKERGADDVPDAPKSKNLFGFLKKSKKASPQAPKSEPKAEKETPKLKKEASPSRKENSENEARKPRPGVADYLAGEHKNYIRDLKPYLPQELVGGSLPYVPGAENESVWNAACQSTGTERVHYTYTVDDNRVWYLACPSSILASNPDSWCPLAAALPGNSEYWDKETVYLYEQEGVASALRWDPETGRMQVFLGAARTLLPRVQSMDANFVTINAEVSKIVPWRNRQLHTEKLSRATAKMLLYVGLLITMAALAILFVQVTATQFVQRDLDRVRMESDQLSTDLMFKALNALQNDSSKYLVRLQELLDHLSTIDGTLVKFEVKSGTVTWEGLVPTSFSNCSGVLGGCQILPGIEDDGRVRIRGNR